MKRVLPGITPAVCSDRRMTPAPQRLAPTSVMTTELPTLPDSMLVSPLTGKRRKGSDMPLDKLTVTIVVPDDIRDFFATAVVSGHGGYQTLCRMVAERMQGTKVMKLSTAEFKRLVRYATHYGNGGFQAKFRAIVICWVDQHIDELVKE